MSHNLVLQEGAILIADAHYSKQNPQLFSFLKDIESKKIKTTQLILMGDIFELLFGTIKKTIKDNQEEVNLINKISLDIEVIYFEGNHDFNLKKVFPNVKVFPIQNQPQVFNFNNQKVELSHGDTKTPFGYQLYTKFIRNRAILSCIGFVNILCFNCVIKWLKSRGEEKNQAYKINSFKEIIQTRLKNYEDKNLDIVIEGHFHQDTSFELYNLYYKNLSAFSCNRKYFIVQSNKEQLFLQDLFYKETN